MIRSMTGFGDAAAQEGGVHYFLEVRSLNNKYFKAVIRLPDDLQSLEADLESSLRKRLSRGTVTLTAKRTNASASAALEINTAALDRYIAQLKGSESISKGDIALDITPLLALPGVLNPPADDEARLDKAREVFRRLVDEASDHLISMRQREGHLLLTELKGHRDYIAERLEEIARLAPGVIDDYEQRLKQRIENLLEGAGQSFEPQEFVREIAVYAEKTDIAEEIARLRGHIGQFTDMLDAEDDRPIGRTLDFLSQEMLREANTIASKTPDAAVSRLIVEIKGAIDRIKEQSANVE
ncbi:MAG: YicC/YloC family endoribonuclease [Planctomycetota bacterium]